MDDDLSLETWTSFSSSDRKAWAERLARQLPSGFIFDSLQTYSLGGGSNDVAKFKKDDLTFVLIPGGSTTVGYDEDRSWDPTPEELHSWEQSVKKLHITCTIHEHIKRATLRPRKVRFRPFLFETVARQFCWEPISSDDPKVQEFLKDFQILSSRDAKRKTKQLEGRSLRILFGENGQIRAFRSRSLTHENLTKEWKTSGFRLPTSDELEYACGATSATLFRWGDHAPWEYYPTDEMAESLHLRPNSFGVFIASDPYRNELTAEPGISRGGDGGC